MTQQQYTIPMNLCQWCYKITGRYIIDCLCLVCEQCFNNKKNWYTESGKCYFCTKQTSRKTINIKQNPQQSAPYFQNTNMFMKNLIKINQFQHQVSRKYCKHLQFKIKRYEEMMNVVSKFLNQYPQFKGYFEENFNQIKQNKTQNKPNESVKSKSLQTRQPKGANFKGSKQSKSTKSIPSLINPSLGNEMPNSKIFPNSQSSIEMQNNFNRIDKNSQTSQNGYLNDKISNNLSKYKLNKQLQKKNISMAIQRQIYQSKNNPEITKNQVNSKDSNSFYPINYNTNYQKLTAQNNKNSNPQKSLYQRQYNNNTYMNNINVQTAYRSIKSQQQRKYAGLQKSMGIVTKDKKNQGSGDYYYKDSKYQIKDKSNVYKQDSENEYGRKKYGNYQNMNNNNNSKYNHNRKKYQ